MIPLVIDNQDTRLADVLNRLLSAAGGRPVDIATAYFSISGYRLYDRGFVHAKCCLFHQDQVGPLMAELAGRTSGSSPLPMDAFGRDRRPFSARLLTGSPVPTRCYVMFRGGHSLGRRLGPASRFEQDVAGGSRNVWPGTVTFWSSKA